MTNPSPTQTRGQADRQARLWTWFFRLALVALTWAVYFNALDNPFVFDDQRTVVLNPSFDWGFSGLLAYERFRPLVNLSYWLDYELWGFEPLGYHLTSLALHLGSVLLEKYGIKPYISVEMDQERLFRKLKREHPSIGALGIACIPELAMGMRLCLRTGIPPVGIPLNANRCARWMSQAHETSFNVAQLEELLK